MKKYGFTLAEVLITLGIIGVVAALTLPNLQADVVQRQIGPKLAKAVSSFEQASEALLNDEMADSLIDAEIVSAGGTGNNYASNLTNFMKATSNANVVTSKDGFQYTISSMNAGISSQPHPHNNLIGSVTIDINGTNPPGANGEDIFFFSLYDDGSLRPFGSANYLGTNGTVNNGTSYNNNCDRTHNSNLTVCAGYIFDNNLKADYKID